MKAKLMFVAMVMIPGLVYPQFYVGNGGLTVRSNTIFSVNGLTLTPSQNVVLSNNAIRRETVAVSNSIARVYKLNAPITYTGMVRIAYQESELNGNLENQLQIAHSPDGISFLVSPGSVVNPVGNYLNNTLSNATLMAVTAVAPSNMPQAMEDNNSENNEVPNSLLLMGNPVQESAILRYMSQKSGAITLQLFGMNGQTVLVKKEEVMSGVNWYSLTTASLPSGVYILRLSDDQQTKVLKLVKQ